MWPVIRGPAKYSADSTATPRELDDCRKAPMVTHHSHQVFLRFTALMVCAMVSRSCRDVNQHGIHSKSSHHVSLFHQKPLFTATGVSYTLTASTESQLCMRKLDFSLTDSIGKDTLDVAKATA